MSSTRHAQVGSAFRQERYMSSPDLHWGLLANCVASKCSTVELAAHRKLIWFLALLSQEPGGLGKAASEMIELFPDRFFTRQMQTLGLEEGRIYGEEECKLVRSYFDLEYECGETHFPLQGDRTRAALPGYTLPEANPARVSYPVEAFRQECRREASRQLGKFLLEELALNPRVKLDREQLWYLPDLEETLSDYLELWVKRGAAPVTTQIGRQIEETLEYALDGRCLVVIEGLARTGKTFAVENWCRAHPGEVRYVQTPSSNDDLSFFRAICASLGLACGSAYKTTELREKIVETVSGGDLMLVFDEGHYLFPQRNLRKAVPHRINWILTQLVNMGVPVALVTTPQFTKSQETLVKHGGWSSEQLIGRIMHYERLPEELSEEDMLAVAGALLPDAAGDCLRMLVAYARTSEKYLAGIESLARRALYVAAKAGRQKPSLVDVSTALKQGVVPSDNAMLAALSDGQRSPGGRRGSRLSPARSVTPAPVKTHRADSGLNPLSPPPRATRPASFMPAA